MYVLNFKPTDTITYDTHDLHSKRGNCRLYRLKKYQQESTPFLTQKVDAAQVLKYGMPRSAMK
jgi:hypothetical protein